MTKVPGRVTVSVLIIIGLALAGVAAYDLVQRKHAILRNFPLVGHLRYLLESVGPELRQYIVTSNHEERPFSRDQRRWVYASSKQQNSYFGFGFFPGVLALVIWSIATSLASYRAVATTAS